MKNNDLKLSYQKQIELAVFHPDVVVARLLKMAKNQMIYKAATLI